MTPIARTPSLEELARRAREGEETAFEDLYRRLAGGLKRFLHRRTGAGEEIVEELAQHTWVEAWRALRARRYDPRRAAFSTFLYAVGHKIVLRHLESRRRRRREVPLEEGALRVLSESVDQGELLDFCALLEALRACLRSRDRENSLPEEERLVVEKISRGASERKLAEALGVAPSTVHARKRSAIERLRRCLAAKGFRSLEELGAVHRKGRGNER